MTAYLWIILCSFLFNATVAYVLWCVIRPSRLRANLLEIEADLVDAAEQAGLMGDSKVQAAMDVLDDLARNASEFTFSAWLVAVLDDTTGGDPFAASPEWPKEFESAWLRARVRAAARLELAATRESLAGILLSIVFSLSGAVRRSFRARAYADGVVSRTAAAMSRPIRRASPCY